MTRLTPLVLPALPASGRVMEKAGLQLEGVMREAACKHGVMEDSVMRAVLRTDPR